MKKLGTFLLIGFAAVSLQNSAFAQSSNDTGLPIAIGQNSTDRNKANLYGKVIIQGIEASQRKPIIFVSAFYNGVLVDRRQAYDNGSYLIPGVPRENVIVSVEVDGVEYGRQILQSSIMGNLQQDFTINLAQGKNTNQKSGIISAKDLYRRSEENEKNFEKARSAAKDKKFDKAASMFLQIVETDPKDFVAWTELGTAYFQAEKYDEAEKTYQKALDQKPDYLVALLNLGKLLLNQKHADQAIPVLTKAVETDPQNVDSLHYLGEAYLETKQGNNAAILFYEALRLAPLAKAELHLRLARLYHAKGYKNKAAEEYKQFLKKIPNHADKEKMENYIRENLPK